MSALEPADGSWRSWHLPGDRPRAYAVYVVLQYYGLSLIGL